jgi:ribosomal protein S1
LLIPPNTSGHHPSFSQMLRALGILVQQFSEKIFLSCLFPNFSSILLITMVEQRLDGGVESCPRGGVAPRKSTEEPSDTKLKRKSVSVETDFLFGKKKEEPQTAKKSKKRKTSTGGSQSMLPIGGGGVIVPSSSKKKSSSATIEALGFSKLAQNTKVLAVVKEVQDEFAVVSLPNLLTGYMLPSDTSDYPLPSCLKVGQTLAVAVQKVVTETVKGQPTPRRRIQVSALPKAINVRDEDMFQKKNLPIRGQITSIEDHGCLVDLGLGRKGFLKFEDIQGKYAIVVDDDDTDDEEEETEKEHTLLPGRLLDFYILSNSNNVYSLKLPSKKTLVNQAVAPPATSKSAPYTLSSITPGWLVNAKIEAIAKNGLCVTFLGNVFRGAIEMGHLGGYHIPTSKEDDAWKALFQKHQHFPARVIAVDIPTKLIRLTLLPHVMEYKAPPPLPSVGSIIEDCTVVRTDPGIGALFALPEAYTAESPGMSKKLLKSSELFQNFEFQDAASIRAVYVHISKALEGEKDANSVSVFGKEFAPSTKHTVRIMSHGNWMDGVASGACAPSILEAHVLTHSDLKAGQVYKQVPVVTQLQGGSVLVQLGGNGIRALVPPLHLLDSSNANSEYRKKIMQAKFAVDSKVDVRVLWVDPIKKKCLATAKKSLVKAPDDEIISSYEDLKLGGKATGFVSKVDKKAMYVTFCNRVYGVVTARSLAAELGMENIQDNYAIGDVVTCRIVKLKKRTPRRSSLSNASDEEDNDADDGTRAYWEVTLSLKVDSDDVVDDDQLDLIDVTHPKQVQIQAGAILPMKSMKIVELVKGKRKDKGAFVPGYAIVSIKSKHLLDSSECDTMVPNMECKLPYDQILDEYSAEDIESVEALDALAESVLRVGKKINQKGIILTDPRKSNVDYSSGIGKLTVVSIRKNLIQTAERQYAAEESKPEDIILPAPKTTLFVGALLQGYVAQVDPRYGAFIRFLDGLTGLVPKKSGGLDMPLFETVVSRVKAIDEAKGQMHLQPINPPSNTKQQARSTLPLNVGDSVEAKIEKIDFFSITLHILDDNLDPDKTHAILHCTMKDSAHKKVKYHKKSVSENREKITKVHPFYGLKAGQLLSDLTVVFAKRRKGKFQVYLTDRSVEISEDSMAPTYVSQNSELEPGMKTSVVVTGVAPKNKGVYVEASPFVKGFIPGIELSKDLKILNDIESQVAVGSKITCCVMDQKQWNANHAKNMNQSQKNAGSEKSSLMFSVLACDGDSKVAKPARGDLIIGRIHRGLKQALSPSLMLALRGGFVGRCCITELEENDEWENMPIGRLGKEKEAKKEENNDESMDVDEEEEESAENEDDKR